MDRLGPFEPDPVVAVAVSGGADSLAAAVLTDGWVRGRGGRCVAMVVDHGLRPESAEEQRLTQRRLDALGIESIGLALSGLVRGPGLAARARDARHGVLEQACAARGILHLVFGHHAADQAETVVMRMLAHSGPAGLAGMAALTEAHAVRRLRPLLSVAPGRLRAFLRRADMAWVEDPSNADPTQQRARIRALRGDPDGTGKASRAYGQSSAARGLARAAAEAEAAVALARHVVIHPFGYAVQDGAPMPALAWAGLLAMIGGAARLPALAQVEPLAARPRPATLAGVQIRPAGRLGAGWLLVREARAMAPPVAAGPGAIWDRRFRLLGSRQGQAVSLGAWGREAPRDRAGLPSAVLQTLPALRHGGQVIRAGAVLFQPPVEILYSPAISAASPPFFPLLPI